MGKKSRRTKRNKHGNRGRDGNYRPGGISTSLISRYNAYWNSDAYIRTLELGDVLRKGDLAKANELEAAGIDVVAPMSPAAGPLEGYNAVHAACAAEDRDPKPLEWVLDRIPGGTSSDEGASRRGVDGSKPMHLAAGNGLLRHVQLLCEREGCWSDVNDRNGQGASPFLLAVQGGHVDVVEWMLSDECSSSSGGVVTPSSLLRNPDRNTEYDVFFVACAEGHLPVAKVLRPMIRSEDLDRTQHNGATPILIACQLGRLSVVRWLLRDVKIAYDPSLKQAALNGGKNAESVHKYLKEFLAKTAIPLCGQGQSGIACAYCSRENKKYKECECRLVSYCDADCQREHWNVHKRVCCCRNPAAVAATVIQHSCPQCNNEEDDYGMPGMCYSCGEFLFCGVCSFLPSNGKGRPDTHWLCSGCKQKDRSMLLLPKGYLVDRLLERSPRGRHAKYARLIRAQCMLHDAEQHTGVHQDIYAAMAEYMKLAREEDYALAQYFLAGLLDPTAEENSEYADGPLSIFGVNSVNIQSYSNPFSPDAALARELYERAVMSGFHMAMQHVGTMYKNGNRLYPLDKVKGAKLLKDASARGDPKAMCNFASMLMTGDGIPKNEKKGRKLLRRVAFMFEVPGALLRIAFLAMMGEIQSMSEDLEGRMHIMEDTETEGMEAFQKVFKIAEGGEWIPPNEAETAFVTCCRHYAFKMEEAEGRDLLSRSDTLFEQYGFAYEKHYMS